MQDRMCASGPREHVVCTGGPRITGVTCRALAKAVAPASPITIVVEDQRGECAIILVILRVVKPARKSRHHCPFGCFSSAVARVFRSGTVVPFLQGVARRSTRRQVCIRAKRNGIFAAHSLWRFGLWNFSAVRFARGRCAHSSCCHAKAFFSASVAHAFSAGKTKALEGCLIVA